MNSRPKETLHVLVTTTVKKFWIEILIHPMKCSVFNIFLALSMIIDAFFDLIIKTSIRSNHFYKKSKNYYANLTLNWRRQGGLI